MLKTVRASNQALRTPATVTLNILTGVFCVAIRVIRQDANDAQDYGACNVGTLARARLMVRTTGKDIFTGATNVSREFNTVLIVGRPYHLAMRRDASGVVTGWVNGVQEANTYSGDAGSIGNSTLVLGAGTSTGGAGLNGLVCDYAIWTPSTGVPTDAELMAIGRNPVPIRDLYAARVITTVPMVGALVNRQAQGNVAGTEPDCVNWVNPGTNNFSSPTASPPTWSVESPFATGLSPLARAAAVRGGRR